MIRSIIVDDEDKARHNLLSLIGDYCKNVEVLTTEGSVKDGVKSIKKYKPDLVFLDIKMQQETGFDLLERLFGHRNSSRSARSRAGKVLAPRFGAGTPGKDEHPEDAQFFSNLRAAARPIGGSRRTRLGDFLLCQNAC